VSTIDLKSKLADVHASHPPYFGIAAIVAAVAVPAHVVFLGVTGLIAVINGNTVSVASSVGHIASTPVASLWSPRLDVPTPVRTSALEIKNPDIVRNDPGARALPNWVAHPFVAAAGPAEPNKSKDKLVAPDRKVAARSNRWIPVEVLYEDGAGEYAQSEILYDKCTRNFRPVQCYMPPNFGRDIPFREY
jgi:hypothetical protein